MDDPNVPKFVLTDSYKMTHFQQYPEARKMVAYGEFRRPYDSDAEDQRIVYYGMTYILKKYLFRRWTREDLNLAASFLSTHMAGFSAYPFPRDLFESIITENDGYFPVRIESLPEGSVVYPHIPVYQITAESKYARLVTFLETLLTMVWYPTNVATLSRRCKQAIEDSYNETVDEDSMWTLESRLHDFGFRGCTCLEQSIIGGCAHLLNFSGTDTMSAAYYVQYELNDGNPVGSSIPATEHSVMTSWPTETEAVNKMIEMYGSGVYACVMDSYDYDRALREVIPAIAESKTSKGGFLVVRPDSGDQVKCVISGIQALEKVFGSTVNSKGYKVINGAGIIQGDGVSQGKVRELLEAMKHHGYAAQNSAFGMGAGLLQKHNRDTMSFATKLSHVEYLDGRKRNVMKKPTQDSQKTSLPGELAVYRDPQTQLPIVYPKTCLPPLPSRGEPMLRVVYDGLDPSKRSESPKELFSDVRLRVEREWHGSAKVHDPISPALRQLIQDTLKDPNFGP